MKELEQFNEDLKIRDPLEWTNGANLYLAINGREYDKEAGLKETASKTWNYAKTNPIGFGAMAGGGLGAGYGVLSDPGKKVKKENRAAARIGRGVLGGLGGAMGGASMGAILGNANLMDKVNTNLDGINNGEITTKTIVIPRGRQGNSSVIP